jgi:LysM repeat protein
VQNVVIGIAILACVLAGLYVMARVDFSNRASVSRAAQSVEMSQVVVTPGDSLWNIAQEHEVEGLTTQQTVDLILSTNALSSSTLGVGQTLLVPVE